MDGKCLPRPLISGDPGAPLPGISGDEVESEMRRRWAEAPPTRESAHVYRHASIASAERFLHPQQTSAPENSISASFLGRFCSFWVFRLHFGAAHGGSLQTGAAPPARQLN